MARSAGVVSTIGALAAVALFVGLRERANRSELDDLKKQVGALSAAVADGKETQATVATPFRPPLPWLQSVPTGSASTAPSNATPQASAPPKPMTVEEIRADHEQKFESDPTDPSWKAQEQRRAEAKIRAALPTGSQILSMECRETQCKLMTGHDTRAGYDEFIHTAFSYKDPVWSGPVMAMITKNDTAAGGAITAEVYMTRAGEDGRPTFVESKHH